MIYGCRLQHEYVLLIYNKKKGNYVMGDKGGKKDKNKEQKQKQSKEEQKKKEQTAKHPQKKQ